MSLPTACSLQLNQIEHQDGDGNDQWLPRLDAINTR